MKPGKKQKIIFLTVVLALLALPLYFILRSENMLSDEEHIYRFRPRRLIDPADPLRGNYMVIDFDNTVKLIDGAEKDSREVFVVLAKDSLGYAYFDYATFKEPEVSGYFKAVYRNRWRSGTEAQLAIDIPFDKYFINEDNAKLAEKLYLSEVRKMDGQIFIDVAIKDGEALLKEVYFRDTPLNQYMNELSDAERRKIEEEYENSGRRRRRF